MNAIASIPSYFTYMVGITDYFIWSMFKLQIQPYLLHYISFFSSFNGMKLCPLRNHYLVNYYIILIGMLWLIMDKDQWEIFLIHYILLFTSYV